MSQLEATGPIAYTLDQTSATAEIAAATAARKSRLLGGVFATQGAGIAVFSLKSNTTVIFGPVEIGIRQPLTLPASGIAYCETALGEALNLVVTQGEVSASLAVQIVK